VAADAPPPPEPVERLLERAAELWPDKTALDFYDQAFSFAELHSLARRAAKGLIGLGVRPGDRVGLHLPNTPHYVIGLFGALMADAVVVNLSPLAAAEALRAQVEDCGARVVLTLDAPEVLSRIAPLAEAGLIQALVVGRTDDFGAAPGVVGFEPGGDAPGLRQTSFRDLIANDGDVEPARRGDLADEVAVLQFTGGTTGAPKAAMLTHANFSAAMASYRGGWEFDRAEGSSRRILVVLPMFHIVALTCSVLQMAATGASLIVHLRFDTDRTLDDIGRKGVNVFSGVPSMYALLAHHPRAKALASLRYCFSSGAPFPGDTLERFRALTGVTPRSGYGLTETTTAGAFFPEGATVKPGSVGWPSPLNAVEIRDVETGGRLLPDGEAGEVCIRGPQVMKGYWNRPEETAEALRGGCFHTGDIGYLDAEGRLVLVDRKKDMILSGGFNVFPSVVEAAIRTHPAVEDAAVVGVAHPILGQGVKAFVTTAPGQAAPSLVELRGFLAGKLARYEIPTALQVRDALPKTDIGKPDRAALLQAKA
jgi:long-chain acyl-CoA synthetase